MGSEVVYCHRCQSRLRGDDFKTGAAYRVGDKITCAACLEAISQELPLAERLSLLSKIKEFDSKPEEEPRKSSSGQIKAANPPSRVGPRTRSIPKASTGSTSRVGVRTTGSVPTATKRDVKEEAPPPKSRLPLILGISGGAAALLVVILILALGGKKKPVDDLDLSAPAPRIGAPAAPGGVKPPDAAAGPKGPLDEVRRFCKENPQDLAGHVKAWEKVLWEVGGGPLLAEAKAELEAAKKKLQDNLAPELAAVEEKWRTHIAREEFRTAEDLLEKDRNRYEAPDWTLAIDKRIRETQDAKAQLFGTLKQQAIEARTKNSADEMRAIRDRVAKWGLEGYLSDINRIFEGVALGNAPAPSTAPATPGDAAPATSSSSTPVPEKPLTKEGQEYRRAWEQALLLVQSRKYEDAAAELQKASRSLEEADVKDEARKDVEFIQQIAAFTKEASRVLSEWAPRSRLALTYRDESGNRQTVNEPVHQTDPWHVEFRKKKKSTFVDFLEVTGDALADILKAKKKSLSEDDRRAAAILCLLEGERDKAAQHLGGPADRIPPKYWNYAAEARARAPKPDAREAEARKLYYTAEQEFRAAQTRGNAIEKYKYLRESLAVTDVVRRYQETILKRSEAGKESVLTAGDLTGSGFFRMAPFEGLTAWTCGSDVTNPADAVTTFVDIDFYGLPQTQYRCWVFMGACCMETFTCYMQATELMGSHPEKPSQKVPYEPGKGFAAPVKIPIPKLKKTHASHGGPKQPARWEWVEIPLPKYAAPGPKKLRILSEQQGFSIAFAVVSAVRKGPPDEAETREMAKIKPPPPEVPDRGTPEPKAWYLAFPFDANMGQAFPQEKKIDLKGTMKGKGNANVKWVLKEAELRENFLARIDFKAHIQNPNDTCVYAMIHVQAPGALNCKLMVGSDDGVKVWVNGQNVHTVDRNRAAKVDEDQIPIKLNEGWNRLLFKIRNRDGGYELVMRLATNDGKPIPDLVYDAMGDLAEEE
jgi:hypothetical protein